MRSRTRSCGLTSWSRSGRAASTPPSSSKLKYTVLAALGGGVFWPKALFISLSSPLLLAFICSGVVVVRGQEHLQRELLVPPVHPKTALTAPPRCTVLVVAMQRHVDHWASTKGHTKEGTQTCRACCCCGCCCCSSSSSSCFFCSTPCWDGHACNVND